MDNKELLKEDVDQILELLKAMTQFEMLMNPKEKNLFIMICNAFKWHGYKMILSEDKIDGLYELAAKLNIKI